MFQKIHLFLQQRDTEVSLIAPQRIEQLKVLADYVRERLKDSGVANLTFICTHNSRRSHLSQIWAKVAAAWVGLDGVQTFSGGTEATAMNPRVVESLLRTGFRIDSPTPETSNPVYHVRFSEDQPPLSCFSKVFTAHDNPQTDYGAIMTCASADESCPVVSGCDVRLPIRYEDPKAADGEPFESQVYDERSQQICREMLFAMRLVASSVD